MSANPADWYPDPWGRHELRYWDGGSWSEHVASHGRQATDPPTGDPKTVVGAQSPDRIQRQVHAQAHIEPSATVGGGTLFTEPVLVVNQKAKLIEINAEYAIYDAEGAQIGSVRQVGQSAAKKALRLVASVDQFMTHKFQIVDVDGNVVMMITRPRKLMRSKVLVQDAVGDDIGEVVQENVFGKIRFGLVAGGETVGSINAENWRAWNFNIQDAAGTEVARITKTWEGLAKTMFTTADNYVLQVHRTLDEPLRSLVVASALTVDTALKQDSRGLS